MRELKSFIRKNFRRDNDGIIPFLIDEVVSKDYYAMKFFADMYEGRIRTILDFGANIGIFSAYAHALFPSARIIAVEGNPSTASLLEYNLGLIESLNEYRIDSVLIHKDVRKVSMGVSVDKPGISSSSICMMVKEDEKGMLETTTFDSYINSVEYFMPYIFKFDIEGGEEGIFASEKGKDFIRNSEMSTFELHFGKNFGVPKEYYLTELEEFKDTHVLNILYVGREIIMGNLIAR